MRLAPVLDSFTSLKYVSGDTVNGFTSHPNEVCYLSKLNRVIKRFYLSTTKMEDLVSTEKNCSVYAYHSPQYVNIS